MGGIGSGHGTKRPDHPTGALIGGLKKTYDKQTKHLKSVFSNKPDPSCHAHKRDRDIMAGKPDYGRATIDLFNAKRRKDGAELQKMAIDRRKTIAMEAKDLQDLARELATKAMQSLVDILDNEDSADTAKLQAIQMILDRGFGKPAATVLNFNQSMDAKPSQLDDRSLDQRTKDALSRIERLTSGASEEAESKERPSDLRKYN